MSINFTPAPELPSLNDPVNFNAEAQALFAWLIGTHITEQEALSASDFFSVIGTVSQESGESTGDLFELGANANGRYYKRADGYQVCAFTTPALTADTQLWTGNPFYRPASPYSWTFPSAFIAAPRVQITPQRQTGAQGMFSWISSGGFSVSGCDVYFAGDNASTAILHLIAAGRWV